MYENENVEQLVSQAIALDKEQKYCKRKLDTVKAKLQSKGLAMIDDRNVKYIKFYSEDGSVAVGDSYKMDVLRPDKLKDILSEELWMAKVKESTETKYSYDPKLEQMLTILLNAVLRNFLMKCPLNRTVNRKNCCLRN